MLTLRVTGQCYGLRLYGLKEVMLFGTFALFGEIVRIIVEYRTSRGTQGYVFIRMYGPSLRVTVMRYRTVPYGTLVWKMNK